MDRNEIEEWIATTWAEGATLAVYVDGQTAYEWSTPPANAPDLALAAARSGGRRADMRCGTEKDRRKWSRLTLPWGPTAGAEAGGEPTVQILQMLMAHVQRKEETIDRRDDRLIQQTNHFADQMQRIADRSAEQLERALIKQIEMTDAIQTLLDRSAERDLDRMREQAKIDQSALAKREALPFLRALAMKATGTKTAGGSEEMRAVRQWLAAIDPEILDDFVQRLTPEQQAALTLILDEAAGSTRSTDGGTRGTPPDGTTGEKNT